MESPQEAPDTSLAVPNLLPARMLSEFVYCPRLFHLEWVQVQWADSADTHAGRRDHRRVDEESGQVPAPDELGLEGAQARSVTMSAPGESLIARMDLIEMGDGMVVPVDYKHGRGPENGPAVWDTDRIQVAAQALILRANGYKCEEGIVYYVASKQRAPVSIDEETIENTRKQVLQALELAQEDLTPSPLIDSPKCPRCSLVGICLPDENNYLAGLGVESTEDVRRLYPARQDALPVYVQTQGARIGKKGEELEIGERDKGTRRVRMIDVSQVSIYGNVQITTQALSTLLGRGTPICYFSYGGWFYGLSHGLGNRNCQLRLHQYRRMQNKEVSCQIARGLVSRKIRNCRTLLRRNDPDPEPEKLNELERLARAALQAESTDSLLGIEGAAARAYFGVFPRMIKVAESVDAFDFTGRNRRPPLDPVNALLSLAYSTLVRDWTVTLLAVGLDPYMGFYHKPRFGRPALALDIMEEFRPLVGDSVVLQTLNNGEVGPSDFIRRGPAVSLSDRGRKKFFLAYERRMSVLVRHPIFRYRVSYRQLFEVQARLFARFLSGELDSYDGFRTR